MYGFFLWAYLDFVSMVLVYHCNFDQCRVPPPTSE